MATDEQKSVFGQIDVLFRRGTIAGLTDRELPERFAHDGDETAFAALVERHGAMVEQTCRSRQARARARLRRQLARRGLAPPVGFIGGVIAAEAQAAVAHALANRLARSAATFAAGGKESTPTLQFIIDR